MPLKVGKFTQNWIIGYYLQNVLYRPYIFGNLSTWWSGHVWEDSLVLACSEDISICAYLSIVSNLLIYCLSIDHVLSINHPLYITYYALPNHHLPLIIYYLYLYYLYFSIIFCHLPIIHVLFLSSIYLPVYHLPTY